MNFTNWVISQIKYPAEAVSKGINGRVTVMYTIQSDGSLGDIKYVGKPDPIIGDVVLKAVQSSHKWEPAKNPEFATPFVSQVNLKFTLPDKVTLDDVFVVVEEMPMYPGGDAELLKFIAENTQYPAEAKANNIQGRVILRFIVNSMGRVEDVSVLKGVHPLLDAEAARVVGSLPEFMPGRQGGTPVNVYYMVPVTFTLK